MNTQHDGHNETRKPTEVSTHRLSQDEFTFYSTRHKAMNQYLLKVRNRRIFPNVSPFVKRGKRNQTTLIEINILLESSRKQFSSFKIII